MRTTKYLAKAMEASKARTKAEFASMIGVNRSAITMYEAGERVMDDYTAAKIAELLGIDEMIVIAQANAEREKDKTKREFWKKKAAEVVMRFSCIWNAKQSATENTPAPVGGAARCAGSGTFSGYGLTEFKRRICRQRGSYSDGWVS